jgi:hypothetical protein
MYADAPGTVPRSFAFHGKVDTKEQAKAAVEEVYAHFFLDPSCPAGHCLFMRGPGKQAHVGPVNAGVHAVAVPRQRQVRRIKRGDLDAPVLHRLALRAVDRRLTPAAGGRLRARRGIVG